MIAVREIAIAGGSRLARGRLLTELTYADYSRQGLEDGYYYKFNNYRLYNLADATVFESGEVLPFECVICVTDAENLTDNIMLVLKLARNYDNVLMFVAGANADTVDTMSLLYQLGIPVIKSTPKSGRGINMLLEFVHSVVTSAITLKPKKTELTDCFEIEKYAASIAEKSRLKSASKIRKKRIKSIILKAFIFIFLTLCVILFDLHR